MKLNGARQLYIRQQDSAVYVGMVVLDLFDILTKYCKSGEVELRCLLLDAELPCMDILRWPLVEEVSLCDIFKDSVWRSRWHLYYLYKLA